MKSRQSSTVLIVSDDPGLSYEIGGWLEAAGLQVLECPGPRQNHQICIGLKTHRCPLAQPADLVILDMHPSERDLVDTSPRKDLAAVYNETDTSVIALVDDASRTFQPGVDGTAVLNRLVGRGDLLEAVVDLMPAAELR
jgi:CheY-like chemotaxis protein